MTVVAENHGLRLSDAPSMKTVDYILRDGYGNEFPFNDWEINPVIELLESVNEEQSNTVEVDRVALATLMDEAEDTVDTLDEMESHGGYSDALVDAIDAGEEALGHA